MNRKSLLAACLLVFILATACDLVALPTDIPVPTNTVDAQGTIDRAIQETMAVQTQIAEAVQQTLTAMFTPTASSTPTASLTPTFTITPTLASTATPGIPMVTVSANTNCRNGPGQAYDLLGVLRAGQATEIIGRTTLENYWLVRNPDSPTQVCWLWGQNATVTGNWQALPAATPPPTPTPVSDFAFTYKSMGVGAGYQCVMFNMNITGALVWESYSLTLTNQTHSESWTSTKDAFITYDQWCAPIDTHQNLEAGEPGTASVQTTMGYNPSGNQFSAALTLCTGNGMTGTCKTKTITFTP